MQEPQSVERVPRDSVMYLPLPMPLALAAITGSREGLVTSADLPPQPDDLNDAEAYYTWVGQVERILDERGVLDANHRETMEGLTVARCPGWCHGRHSLAEGPLASVIHELPILLSDESERNLSIVAAQDQDGTVEKPAIEVQIDGDSTLTAEQGQAWADALQDAVTILRVIEREAALETVEKG